ncbi:MAG: serine/threonine protein kinase [Kiritimatiellae bacterium]|nr:serine/threonine protein kinase [Kiritimatiellia bacterium]
MSDNEKVLELSDDPVSEIVCSKCGCEIDVEGLEPFLRVECPDCSHVEIIPTRFASFLLLDLVGTGGMGGVYAAKDESLGRLVAIKVMLKSLGEDQEFVDGFKREAQAIAKLNHPNIAQIYLFGQVKGQPYIVMELVHGERLDKMIESGRAIDQGLIMRIGMEIAEGLSMADEAGLMHGDIKPENILLDEKMHAKLVDFGLASHVNQARGEGIWGTPYYISPEKVKREKVDARSDMYSLGATLYHALAGRPPFDGDTPVDVVKKRLRHSPPSLHQLRPSIDKDAEAIISRMLQIHPSKRHPTYASLIGDLRRSSTALCGRRKTFGVGGAKTKRMVVSRKTSGGSQDPASTSSPSLTAAKGGHRQGRRTKVVLTKRSRDSAGSGRSGVKITSAGKAGGASTRTESVDIKKKKKSAAGFWVGMIFLAILLVSGLVFFIIYKRDEGRKKRTEHFGLIASKEKAATGLVEINALVAKMKKTETAAQNYITSATNALIIVLNQGFDKADPVLVSKAEVDDVEEDKPKKPEPADDVVKKKAPPKRPSPKKKVVDDNAIDGVMSREELDRRRNRK